MKDPDWLLIFDNVEDPKLLDTYWPPCSHGSILLTAHSSDSRYTTTEKLLLRSLSPQASVNLLKSLVEDHVEPKGLEIVATEIGGLPLLLFYLAGVISESHYTMHEILYTLQDRGDECNPIIRKESDDSTAYQYVTT